MTYQHTFWCTNNWLINVSSEHLIIVLLTEGVFNISVPSRLIDASKLTEERFDGNGGLSAVISSVIEAPFYVPFSNGKRSKRFVVSILSLHVDKCILIVNATKMISSLNY